MCFCRFGKEEKKLGVNSTQQEQRSFKGKETNLLPQFIYKCAFRKHHHLRNYFHFLVVMERKPPIDLDFGVRRLQTWRILTYNAEQR